MKEHIAMILAERFCKKDPYQILGKMAQRCPGTDTRNWRISMPFCYPRHEPERRERLSAVW